jgi:hypothetical protein
VDKGEDGEDCKDAILKSVDGVTGQVYFERKTVWERRVYILKHINRHFENEIKLTWRDRQILNRDSCSHVG